MSVWMVNLRQSGHVPDLSRSALARNAELSAFLPLHCSLMPLHNLQAVLLPPWTTEPKKLELLRRTLYTPSRIE